MSIMAKGHKFSVKTTPERIGGEDGKRSFLGQTSAGENTIVIDGTMPKTRQEEVLLHEFSHIADMTISEWIVESLSTNLYPILKENGLLAANFMGKVSDGMLTKGEMEQINEQSMEMAEMQGPMRSTGEKFQTRTDIQTVILSKEKFPGKQEANAWIRAHDFKIKEGAPDETEESWRYRQRAPGEFQEGSFRTITLTEGVKAVIGRPKAE